MRMLKKGPDALLDFIYPPVCLLCDERLEENEFLCPLCRENFLASLRPFIQKGRSDFPHLTVEICFDKVVTCWEYSDKIDQLIHRMKYQNGRKLGYLLGCIAGESLDVYLGPRGVGIQGEGDVTTEDRIMIPVPLHSIRKRERGYNQSEILCRGLASKLNVPVRSDLVRRLRNTQSQTRLKAQKREKNVTDAFCVRNPDEVFGKQIILVDDVCTTGATLNSCAYSLKKAGAICVIGVALARPVI